MFQVVSNRLHLLLDRRARKVVGASNLLWLKKRKAMISVVLFFLIIVSGSALLLNPLQWVTAASYPSQVVSRGLLDVSVQSSGLLQSGVYNLAFQGVYGNLQEIDVKQGQKVVRGQLLARMDTISLQQSVSAAQASLDAAKKNLYGILLHQGDTTASINQRIAAVQEVVNAAQSYVDAMKRDTNVSVIVAKSTLMSDEHTLSVTRKTAATQVKQAEVQRRHSLLLCPTPTPIPTTGTTPVATPGNVLSVVSIPTPTTVADDSAQTDAIYTTCVQQANAIYKQEVASAHLGVTALTAQVEKDQQQVDLAYANSGLNKAGANSQLVNSQNQAIGAETTTDATASISQVKSAEGQLEVATAQLNNAQYNLDHADLTAPHDGIVSAINGTPGGPPGVPLDVATSNSAPYGIFIQIVDLSSVQQIVTNVSEADITSVQVGQPIRFQLKAYNDRQFSGTVSAISPNGVTGGSGITYPVITTIDSLNRDGTAMLPNMTATVTITVLHDTRALRIPASAINVTTDSKKANKVAFLVSKQEGSAATSKAMDMLKQLVKAHPDFVSHKPFPTFVVERSELGNTFTARPVVLGLTDGTYYEVLQGIAENDHVIVGK